MPPSHHRFVNVYLSPCSPFILLYLYNIIIILYYYNYIFILYYNYIIVILCGPGSSVVIATDYGTD